MRIQLLTIAAAVALAAGFNAGGVAQAQTTTTPGARADGATEAKPKVDRKAKKAEDDRIEADYKAAKAKCSSKKGNEKEVCEADAKGKEQVAKAELENKYEPTPAHARKVEEAKAEHEYKVAKEKCDAQKGKEESACEKEAKAKYDRAKADIKAQAAAKDKRAAQGGSK